MAHEYEGGVGVHIMVTGRSVIVGRDVVVASIRTVLVITL
jgi:hypothetical protein